VEAFVIGASLGLAAGVSPGPLLALVLREAVARGFRAGALAALAPLLTDSWAVLLAWLVGDALPGRLLDALQLAGGVYLLYLGGSGLLRSNVAAAAESGGGSLRAAVLVNLTNPHMYAFWFLVGAPLLHRLGGFAWAFLLGFYLLIVGTKIALAWLAARLGQTPLGPATLKVGDLALLGVGGYLLLALFV